MLEMEIDVLHLHLSQAGDLGNEETIFISNSNKGNEFWEEGSTAVIIIAICLITKQNWLHG